MPRQLSGFTDFNPNRGIPSLSGKVIFITGGTAGVGKSTLEQLAQHQPAHLYFTGRNQSAAEQVISFVKDTQPSTSITFIQMDLSSLASVKLAVAQFAHDRLDILICNGGIMDVPPAVSVDGFEIHMATNHLGHALLIDKLLPVMLKTVSLPQADVRIAILSSAGFALHPKDGLAWDKLTSAQSGFVESMTRYGQSKLANLVYAAELARRYPQILSVSVHPGFVATNLIHNSSALAKFYSMGGGTG
uniref:Oxidoreductase n=1 Tax=Bionectria ochroleuca TaxID=29856 RepID=A0A8H7NQC1_BIOOC